MDESKYADLFESIFGFRPKKTGQSYELLTAVAIKSVLPHLRVKADQFVDGEFSGEKYQLDALAVALEKIAIEAKDYSVNGKKVGRPDVTKLAGALIDLPIESGIVASPTDFTRHAKKYSEASKVNPHTKPIELFHVRLATEEDEKGRLTKIHIRLVIECADFSNSKWNPVFTSEGAALLKEHFLIGQQTHVQIEEKIFALLREDGSEIISIYDLSRHLSVQAGENVVLKGTWTNEQPAFVKLKGRLYPIKSYDYEIPFVTREHDIIVESKGKATLLVKSQNGEVDKILTDVDLKKIKFSPDGSLG